MIGQFTHNVVAMAENLERKARAVDIQAGYTISATTMSMPLWVNKLGQWLEFGVLVCGFLIGVTTLVYNIRRLRGKK